MAAPSPVSGGQPPCAPPHLACFAYVLCALHRALGIGRFLHPSSSHLPPHPHTPPTEPTPIPLVQHLTQPPPCQLHHSQKHAQTRQQKQPTTPRVGTIVACHSQSSIGHALLLALLHWVWFSLGWYLQPHPHPLGLGSVGTNLPTTKHEYTHTHAQKHTHVPLTSLSSATLATVSK